MTKQTSSISWEERIRRTCSMPKNKTIASGRQEEISTSPIQNRKEAVKEKHKTPSHPENPMQTKKKDQSRQSLSTSSSLHRLPQRRDKWTPYPTRTSRPTPTPRPQSRSSQLLSTLRSRQRAPSTVHRQLQTSRCSSNRKLTRRMRSIAVKVTTRWSRIIGIVEIHSCRTGRRV